MEKVEQFVEKITKAFEEKLISSTIKGLIIIWLIKEISKVIKN